MNYLRDYLQKEATARVARSAKTLLRWFDRYKREEATAKLALPSSVDTAMRAKTPEPFVEKIDELRVTPPSFTSQMRPARKIKEDAMQAYRDDIKYHLDRTDELPAKIGPTALKQEQIQNFRRSDAARQLNPKGSPGEGNAAYNPLDNTIIYHADPLMQTVLKRVGRSGNTPLDVIAHEGGHSFAVPHYYEMGPNEVIRPAVRAKMDNLYSALTPAELEAATKYDQSISGFGIQAQLPQNRARFKEQLPKWRNVLNSSKALQFFDHLTSLAQQSGKSLRDLRHMSPEELSQVHQQTFGKSFDFINAYGVKARGYPDKYLPQIGSRDKLLRDLNAHMHSTSLDPSPVWADAIKTGNVSPHDVRAELGSMYTQHRKGIKDLLALSNDSERFQLGERNADAIAKDATQWMSRHIPNFESRRNILESRINKAVMKKNWKLAGRPDHYAPSEITKETLDALKSKYPDVDFSDIRVRV